MGFDGSAVWLEKALEFLSCDKTEIEEATDTLGSRLFDGGGFGPWRCGSGLRALTGGGGRAGPAVFGGCGARCFLVDIWGLAAK